MPAFKMRERESDAKKLIIDFFILPKLDLVSSTTSYDNNIGPTFSLEPPSRFDFTHTLRARIDCIASGIPTPNVEWFDSENNPVNSISSVSLIKLQISCEIQFLYHRTDSSHFEQRLTLFSTISRRELSSGRPLDNLQVCSCKLSRNSCLKRCPC